MKNEKAIKSGQVFQATHMSDMQKNTSVWSEKPLLFRVGESPAQTRLPDTLTVFSPLFSHPQDTIPN
jgi:hypothetical protein